MKSYIKFLINLFNNSFLKVFFTFFTIILITNILDQIDFFKDANISFYSLIFLSFLNTPSVVFEILPFIFLISTQVFFIYLIDKKELEIFKYTGLNNLMIIKIISLYTFIVGLIIIIIFFFLMIRRPPRSTLFPYTTSSDLGSGAEKAIEKDDTFNPPAEAVDYSRLQRSIETRSEEHTSELQSQSTISYAVFGLQKK